MSVWNELDELVPIFGANSERSAEAAVEVAAAAWEAPALAGASAEEPAGEEPRELWDAQQRERNRRFAELLVRNPKVARRRGFPIIGYIGDNGSGKTLAAVRDSMPTLLRGGTVVSTTPLFDPLADGPRVLHPGYRPLTSWMEVPTLRNADLLLDEVQSVANARLATSIPPQLLTAFLQLRKQGVVLRWTTTHWARVDTALREVTKAAVICNSSSPSKAAGSDGWRPKRRFHVRTVDAASLDGAYTIQLGDETPTHGVKTLARERYRRKDWWPWLYDSTALVRVLDHVDSSGWCMTCGGHRSRPKCSCGTH